MNIRFAPGTATFMRDWVRKEVHKVFLEEQDNILGLFLSELSNIEVEESCLLFPTGRARIVQHTCGLIAPRWDNTSTIMGNNPDYDFPENGPLYLWTKIMVGQINWEIDLILPRSFASRNPRGYEDFICNCPQRVRNIYETLMKSYWEKKRQLHEREIQKTRKLLELGREVRDKID